MSDRVLEFYEELAGNYHFIFSDWRKSVLRQSESLDRLIRRYHGSQRKTVLDCACGIGTQAIGLAVRGYTVMGTDLSPEAVARAEREARAFDVEMTFAVADFRELAAQVTGIFATVICCDNAIAHMQTEADLARALQSMAARLAPDGLLLLSLRDYDSLRLDQPTSSPPQITDREDGRTIAFQVWDWAADGESYTVTQFILREEAAGWQTQTGVTRLRAWQRAEITAQLAQAGLTGIEWHSPETSHYYQPIVTARKPTE